MTSEKQIAANRRNAAKSTGPRTQQGKTRSRMNALRHGFATSGSSIGDKSRQELELLLEQFELETAANFALLKQSIDPNWPPELIERAVKRIANLERYKARTFTAWRKKIR
jgi:hypothetical protein